MSKTYTFSAKVITDTASAVLLDVGLDEDVWIPKSQIQSQDGDFDAGANVEVEIPEWLAERKGIV